MYYVSTFYQNYKYLSDKFSSCYPLTFHAFLNYLQVVLYEDLALGIDSLATHSPPLLLTSAPEEATMAANQAAATAEEWARGQRRKLLLGEESPGTADHSKVESKTQSGSESSSNLTHPSLRRLWQRLLTDAAQSSSSPLPSPSMKLEHVTSWLNFPRSHEELTSFTLSQCAWCSSTHKKSWGSASTKLATLKFEHLASTKTFSVPGGAGSAVALKGQGKTAGDVAGANDPRWAGVVKGVHRKVRNQSAQSWRVHHEVRIMPLINRTT